ncbi:MAG: type II toxin-antitoxin system prevent-host-death family antitoxin [Desulfuromusa sp.]|jgi:prevent-host-death family protein|nr:type II toxin-antitoxin system prevent-host-death family antitoxin [Desulfuromusa sp.]
MKHISVSDGVIPLGEFKSHAPRYLKNLDGPLIITQNGRPAGVLISPAEYDQIRQQQSFLESIAAGMNDVHAGRVMNEETLKNRLATARKLR